MRFGTCLRAVLLDYLSISNRLLHTRSGRNQTPEHHKKNVFELKTKRLDFFNTHIIPGLTKCALLYYGCYEQTICHRREAEDLGRVEGHEDCNPKRSREGFSQFKSRGQTKETTMRQGETFELVSLHTWESAIENRSRGSR